MCYCLFFFKQKTAYEMRISDWSSDVCSSDLYIVSHSTRQSEKPRIWLPTVDDVYEALAHFDRILHEEKMILEFKLEAGDVVAFNNRRVLHGRREFRALATPPPDSPASGYTRHLERGRASCRERVCQYV